MTSLNSLTTLSKTDQIPAGGCLHEWGLLLEYRNARTVCIKCGVLFREALLYPPEVIVRRREKIDGVWVLDIECPYCGETHRHGAGNGAQAVLGHRLGHCSDTDGYFLAEKSI